MTPIGSVNIDDYYRILNPWLNHQYEHDTFLMVADLVAMTLDYNNIESVKKHIYDMVIDWLSCGIDPSQSVIFLQSSVKQYSEAYSLLSLASPLTWLLKYIDYDCHDVLLKNSYASLGIPLSLSTSMLLVNSSDIIIHDDLQYIVEFCRQLARRFNFLYGREEGFELKALSIIKKLGVKKSHLYKSLLTKYQQNGDDTAIEQVHFLLQDTPHLSVGDRDRLLAFIENKSKVILHEPNTLAQQDILDDMLLKIDDKIGIRDELDTIAKKVNAMQTDSQRIKIDNPGNPDACSVWKLHKIYSDNTSCKEINQGCRGAKLSCVNCKTRLIDTIDSKHKIFRERAKAFTEDPRIVTNILADGEEKVNEISQSVLVDIKDYLYSSG